MTPLQQLLTQTANESGPLTLGDYMALCLTHPQHGYYMTRDPLGANKDAQKGGDFTTAPEISQMFGELIGLWAVNEWQTRGTPNPFTMCELGPGRGTLMQDSLRAAALRPAFLQAMQLYLCEASPVLRHLQTNALRAHNPQYITTLGELPAQPLLLIANEFFDALPVEQYRRHGDTWVQRHVAAQGDELVFVDMACEPPAAITGIAGHDWIAYSPISNVIMAELCTHLKEHHGAALIIDYGYLGPAAGDTLQAMRAHQFISPLADPGEVDLTAHVDFGTLANIAIAGGCETQYMTQGEFLSMLGIHERAAQLGDNVALTRLATPSGMGDLFKVLVVSA